MISQIKTGTELQCLFLKKLKESFMNFSANCWLRVHFGYLNHLDVAFHIEGLSSVPLWNALCSFWNYYSFYGF